MVSTKVGPNNYREKEPKVWDLETREGREYELPVAVMTDKVIKNINYRRCAEARARS